MTYSPGINVSARRRRLGGTLTVFAYPSELWSPPTMWTGDSPHSIASSAVSHTTRFVFRRVVAMSGEQAASGIRRGRRGE